MIPTHLASLIGRSEFCSHILIMSGINLDCKISAFIIYELFFKGKSIFDSPAVILVQSRTYYRKYLNADDIFKIEKTGCGLF